MDNGGWAKPVEDGQSPTLFQEYFSKGRMYIMVMSGKYAGDYLGGHYDKGVGAWSKKSDGGYMSWLGCELVSESDKTAHLRMRYNPNGKFYFYYDKEP
ncbi:unnamed protein product, partial [Rotaria sp. Silwood1]